MLLWRAALGRAVCGAAFVHVGSAYWHYDTGRVRCCQGGIFGNMSADAGGGGDSRLRGNDVGGAGYDVMGGRDGGTQRRKDAMRRDDGRFPPTRE